MLGFINVYTSSNLRLLSVLPTAAIFGKVHLRGIEPPQNLVPNGTISILEESRLNSWTISLREIALGNFSGNHYGWLLPDPVSFIKPIPARGLRNIWNFNRTACMHCGCTDQQNDHCIQKTGKVCSWDAENTCSACYNN